MGYCSCYCVPTYTIVGLPDKAVQEARARVRSAIRNSYYKFPNRRITVNLAPADLKKEGPAYDLPIAIGILPIADCSEELFLSDLKIEGNTINYPFFTYSMPAP